jgi:hypothetical protein
MQAAYDDDVDVKLQIDGTSDPGKLANIVMDSRRKGERGQLAERSLETQKVLAC